IEQPKHIILRKSQARRHVVLGDQVVKQLPLLLQHLRNAALDRLWTDKARHEDRALLTEPMSAIDRLVLDGGVPPAIEQEYVVRELQVQPDRSGAVAHQD